MGVTPTNEMHKRWPSRVGRYRPWVAISVAATASAALLRLSGDSSFERFLGGMPPALAVAAAGVAGLGALDSLERRGFWQRACRSRTVHGLAFASVALLPFAAAAIVADLAAGFPRDTNVPWPQAWLLYPSIALVAETAFHLLPLAGLAWATGSRLHGRSIDARTMALVLPVAAVEPMVQMALGTGLPAFTVVHVYAFGVVQLLLLRRYGYLPMLWFRLGYYLLWHILWGAARLELLY
jgi:hypothetical protein